MYLFVIDVSFPETQGVFHIGKLQNSIVYVCYHSMEPQDQCMQLQCLQGSVKCADAQGYLVE